MKIDVSPAKACTTPSASVAVSRMRKLVVPVATVRPPFARAALPLLGDIGVQRPEQARRALRRFAERDALANLKLFRGPHEGAPLVSALTLVQHALDARHRLAAPANAVKARRDHLRVVHDHD